PIPSPDLTLPGDITLTLSAAARRRLDGRGLDAILSLVDAGDYVAVLAFLPPSEGLDGAFLKMRTAVRDRTRAATMFGYGPRYLHSTGQRHKGGANNGVFVLFTAAVDRDLPIPGQDFSFGTLEMAQALGDFASLDGTGRRAVHVHLPSPTPTLVERV